MNTYREIVEEMAFIDGETEEDIDYGDSETVDSERISDGVIECNTCGSCNIEIGRDEREILKIEWLHTQKDRSWNVNELPENDRIVELGEKLLMFQLTEN